jgi:hypothetical protein
MDKSSSLGMPMSPQEISKKYKRQSLGMPPRHPFFIGKNQVTFQDTIFIASCTMHFSWSVSCFCFQFFFFAVPAAINIGSHYVCFGERLTASFIAKNTLVFTLIVQRVFSFSATAFSFYFSP